MARVFDGDEANFLQAATTFAAGRNQCTIGAWFKVPSTTNQGVFLSLAGGGDRLDLEENYESGVTNYIQGQNTGGGVAHSNQGGPSDSIVPDTWILTVFVIDGVGEVSHFYVGDVELGGNTGPYVGMSTNLTDLYVGIYQGFAAAVIGKVAHVFGFARMLSGAEITSLLTNDPSTLTSTSREFYYPLVTSSLANEWTPVSGDSIGTLTENGTVAWDTDTPYSAGSDIDIDLDAGARTLAGQSIDATIHISIDAGSITRAGQSLTADIDGGEVGPAVTGLPRASRARGFLRPIFGR